VQHPPLAPVESLRDRLGVDADVVRLAAHLDDASALVRAEAGQSWIVAGELDGVPDEVVRITLAVARAMFENPQRVSSDQTGPFSVSYSQPDRWLSDEDRRSLARFRPTSDLWTQSTTRGDLEIGINPAFDEVF
jgi:hypothetical protein